MTEDDVLIQFSRDTSVSWTRAEVKELAENLRRSCASALLAGERMKAQDKRDCENWIRNSLTFAAVALETLAEDGVSILQSPPEPQAGVELTDEEIVRLFASYWEKSLPPPKKAVVSRSLGRMQKAELKK
jgi:hypothetical protein